MTSPTWYDLLGIAPQATPAEIKAAWRDATDKFEPGTGGTQFRLFSEAADVLLDPVRRAGYDAEIGLSGQVAEEPAVEPAPAPEEAEADAPESPDAELPAEAVESAESGDSPERSALLVPVMPPPAPEAGTEETQAPPARARRQVPPVAAAVLSVLAIGSVVLAVILGTHLDSRVQTATAGSDAAAAADRALTAVLSYDYRHMDADAARSAKFLTPGYAAKYLKTFALLTQGPNGTPGGAVKTQAVVTANVLNTGVVDADPNRVRVIAFVNQTSIKGTLAPAIFQNRVVVTMVRSGNDWLVDNVVSY